MALSAVLASTVAPAQKLPLRRDSSSSVDSDDSSTASETPISYATDPNRPKGEPTPPTTKQKVDRRPPSTYYLKPRAEMTLAEKICDLATCPTSMHELKPESLDRGPIPRQPALQENVYIVSRALVPLAIQQASYWLFPNHKWPSYVAYPFYVAALMGFALRWVARLNDKCVELGTFDEKNIGRDRTPDKSVKHLATGITLYMVVRTALPFYHYTASISPLFDFTWTYPLRLAAWQVTLDYFFYVYHRASHEVDALWFIHRHHHTTKHPTAILAILAEEYQECLEVFLIPLTATLLVPMTFSEMWMTLCYTL
ncbi:hypothetical protein JCM3770_005999, partial [Rhodotorula araucariae]